MKLWHEKSLLARWPGDMEKLAIASVFQLHVANPGKKLLLWAVELGMA